MILYAWGKGKSCVLHTAKPESIGQYEIKGKTEDICLKPDMPFAFQVPEGNKNTYNFSLFFFPFSGKIVSN